MRGLLILTLLHAVSTHGQKCGMAMQVQPQDQLSPGSTVALPKEQTGKLLDSIDTPLNVDYIRCDGDNGVGYLQHLYHSVANQSVAIVLPCST